MNLYGTGGAARRHVKAGLLLGAGTALALSVLAITPAAAADTGASLKAQIDALVAQVTALAAHDQAQTAQIKALNDQIQQLKATPAPAPVAVAAPPAYSLPTIDQAPVVATAGYGSAPGNVPGHAAYAPEAANGCLIGCASVVGQGPAVTTAPFASFTGTSPVGAGNPTVKLSLSGQVDRMEVYGNDGRASSFVNEDNNISSTRFRFQGESWINSTTSAGAYIEAEIRPNSSSNTALTTDGSNSVTNFTGGVAGVGSTTGAPANNTTAVPTVRWADTFITNTYWGAVHLGFGASSGYLTAENDLSGTFYAGYVNASDTDGGFSFRQNGAALLPVGTAAVAATTSTVSTTINGKATTIVTQTAPAKAANATALALSPNGAFGPTVASVFFFFDGDVRNDRIRYDSPLWNGFQFSTSEIDGGATDVALRYAAEWFGTEIQAAGAATFATSLNHGTPAAYGYSSGIPTAANAAAAQGTIPLSYQISTAGSNQYDGSVALYNKPTGLNLAVAGGFQDVVYQDPLHHNLDPTLLYVKGGWKTPTPWFDFGTTAFALGYLQNDNLIYAGDRAKEYQVLLEQEITPAAMSLYASYHHQTLDREAGSYLPIDLITVGAVARF
jgi:hypothetical protein